MKPGLVHYLLHKPAGVITTAADPQGRPTVVDLVPAEPRVFPVGRLDADSEGLLLLTNDGDLTHRLTHPSFGVDKEYLVEVEGEPSRGALAAAARRASSSTTAAPRRPRSPSSTAGCCASRSTRVATARCAACARRSGHPVVRLVRTRIGPLTDRSLKPGEWRALTQDEVRALERAAAGKAPR